MVKRKVDEVNDYDPNSGDNTNSLMETGPRKKKKDETSRVVTASGQKLDLKKSAKIKGLRAKKEEKITKSQKREMKRLEERKKEKKSRAELIAGLQEFQLSSTALSQITPTVSKNKKDLIEKVPKFPNKLRAVGSNREEGAKKGVQVHYDTGSSDEDEEEESEENQKEDNTVRLANVTEPKVVVVEEKQEAPKVVTRFEAKMKKKAEEKEKKKTVSEAYLKLLTTIKGTKVVVNRQKEIEKVRAKLPIYAEEQGLVEAINENTITIISGETGSGKTTQIPQFLYEAGYTSNGHIIGVTEPRRVAAMSMSSRVGVELNDLTKASYQIRFEGNRSDETKILFMTDGVLLKELQADFQLAKFSVIVIDEAHERSMYSDVLIGLLSRIAIQRAKAGTPLKLVIMSATLRISDFMQTKLFPTTLPKVVNVESRQFPVTVHFEKKTPDDYIGAAFMKVSKIHERLPDGGILVFVSGYKEVHTLVKQLSAKYPERKQIQKEEENEDFFEIDDFKNLEDFDEADDDMDSSDEEKEEEDEFNLDKQSSTAPSKTNKALHCVPLYSMMSSDAQNKVFVDPPEGTRLCVIATNVAETSLTIPNISYVVDTGKEKRRDYDPVSGVSQFTVSNISQASANQRSGRAGRVSAGHAYRLYSSAVFEDFQKFPPPEILHKPVDQVVLHLKAMNIRNIKNFPFPTPPEIDQISKAEDKLTKLGALELLPGQSVSSITILGKTILYFPLASHFGKMLVMSNQHSVMPYILILVSALTVREPLVNIAGLEGSDNAETQELMVMLLKQRRIYNKAGQARRFGDLNVLLRALMETDQKKLDRAGCIKVGLRYEAVKEIRKMRRQLTNMVNSHLKLKEPITLDPNLKPPSETQLKVIRQIFVACQTDQIARKVRGKAKGTYQTQKLEELVLIDTTSTLYNDDPDYVLYQDIFKINGEMKMQMVSEVEPVWLETVAKDVKFPELNIKLKESK